MSLATPLLDTANLITAFLDDTRTWAIVPDSMARAIKASDGLSIYRLRNGPPDRLLFLARRTRLSTSTLRGCALLDEALERVLPAAARLGT